MAQWFMIVSEDSTNGDRLYKTRAATADEAHRIAEETGVEAPYRLLDEGEIEARGRYNYGFQLLFRLATEITPQNAGRGSDAERHAA